MADEGGANAHRACIPKDQNSGAQARVLARFMRQCKPRLGDQFVLRIRGGCRLRSATAKRDFPSTHVLSKRQQGVATTFDASSDQLRTISPNDTYVYVPLPDLRSGSYTLDTNYDTGGEENMKVQRVEVVDSDGDVYFTSDRPVNGKIVFDVDDVDEDDPIPAGLIVDTARSINVTYFATATLASNTTSSADRAHLGVKLVGSWIMAIMIKEGMTLFVL